MLREAKQDALAKSPGIQGFQPTGVRGPCSINGCGTRQKSAGAGMDIEARRRDNVRSRQTATIPGEASLEQARRTFA